MRQSSNPKNHPKPPSSFAETEELAKYHRDLRRLYDSSSNIRDRKETCLCGRVCICLYARVERKEEGYKGAKLRIQFLRFVPGTVEIHHGPSVMPGNATGRCTSHIHFAREAYRAPLLHIDVFRSQDRRLSSCNTR